jgi:hypothetical protein
VLLLEQGPADVVAEPLIVEDEVADRCDLLDRMAGAVVEGPHRFEVVQYVLGQAAAQSATR